MRIAAIVCVIVGISGVAFFLFADSLEEWVATEEGLHWLEAQGPVAGLAGMGLIASDVLLPMPAAGVMAALGTIYGGFVGGLYALGGSIAAGLIAYGSTRVLGRRAAARIAGEEKLVALEHFFARSGAWAIAMTRILPVVPEILCCLAGLAPMPFGRFFIALCCGSIPISFLFTFYASTSNQEPLLTILIATLTPAVLFLPSWALFTRIARRRPAENDPA